MCTSARLEDAATHKKTSKNKTQKKMLEMQNMSTAKVLMLYVIFKIITVEMQKKKE